jgi:protein-S-isoprenylcysteine O-methyltransferase Ste14
MADTLDEAKADEPKSIWWTRTVAPLLLRQSARRLAILSDFARMAALCAATQRRLRKNAMSDVTARPNSLPWPPIIYLAAIAVSVLLNVFYPLPWFGQPLSGVLFVLGWLMIAAFVALNISAIRTMRRAGTTVRPDRGTDHLVTDGPFSFTRNPLYLAGTMLVLGIGLIAGIVWFLLLAILAAFAVQKLAIEREERHLQARFGETYLEYAARVRRWI